MFYSNDARDYAERNGGRTVDMVPIAAGENPFRVRVVGSYYGQILVEPIDENEVPNSLKSLLKEAVDYNLSLYVLVPNGKILAVPMHVLKELVAPAKILGRFPHTCPRCFKPCYLGIVPASLDCSWCDGTGKPK